MLKEKYMEYMQGTWMSIIGLSETQISMCNQMVTSEIRE